MFMRGLALLKKEPVLAAAALCAALTLFAVPPTAALLGAIDLRVLALLFCLMAVVAGLQSCGVFNALARGLLCRCRSPRALGAALVLLPFFTSMLITNDVALLTFVPFTLMLLETAGCSERAIPVLVLQTVGANLGSMATPVGNPQNLYLYSRFQLSAGDFFTTLAPYTLLSLVLLGTAGLFCLPAHLAPPPLIPAPRAGGRRLAGYAALFALCLLCVFRALPWPVLLAVVLVALFAADRTLLCRVDYALLATFVCFFIVSANLGALPAVRGALQRFMAGNTLLTGVLTSQIISNVPAAILLSDFTADWRGLLLGVDLGGLGTPIASLASVITLKFYLAAPRARGGAYLAVFTAINFLALAVLLLPALL